MAVGEAVAAAEVAVVGEVAVVVAECEAAAGVVDSAAVRPAAVFPEAGGRLGDQRAEGVAWRVVVVALPTAVRRSVLLVERDRVAERWPEAGHRSNPARVLPLAAPVVRDQVLASASGRQSALEARDRELVSGNCRLEARGPEPASASDQAPVPGLRPVSGRLLCPGSAAARVWEAEIERRTGRRRARVASPVSRIGWRVAIG